MKTSRTRLPSFSLHADTMLTSSETCSLEACRIRSTRLSAIVVTWDHDFDRLVQRVPRGKRATFRRLGRISFRCNETQGRRLVERWIESIEFHYEQAQKNSDLRMIPRIASVKTLPDGLVASGEMLPAIAPVTMVPLPIWRDYGNQDDAHRLGLN